MTGLAEIQRRVGVTPDGIWGPRTARAILDALPPVRARTLEQADAFYVGVRYVTGALDPTQFKVVEALLASASHWSTAWLAYGLATAWHEARLRPIEEISKGKGRSYGKPGIHSGQIAYGRGLVQLTWDRNYARADAELGLNGALIGDYDRALRADTAVAILVRGMEEAWFTGKGLGDYLPDEHGTVDQFRAARRIINGTDRADLIAGYAKAFQAALVAGGWAS